MMSSRRSDIFPSRRNPGALCEDELPQTPHPPMVQKRITCDVSDISVASDSTSEVDNALFLRKCQRRNFPNPAIPLSNSNDIQTLLMSRTDPSNIITSLSSRKVIDEHLQDETCCQNEKSFNSHSGFQRYTLTSRTKSPIAKCVEHCFQPGCPCKTIIHALGTPCVENGTSEHNSDPGFIPSCKSYCVHQTTTQEHNYFNEKACENLQSNSHCFNGISNQDLIYTQCNDLHHGNEVHKLDDGHLQTELLVNHEKEHSSILSVDERSDCEHRVCSDARHNTAEPRRSSNSPVFVAAESVSKTSKTHCPNNASFKDATISKKKSKKKTSAKHNPSLKVPHVVSKDNKDILPLHENCKKHSELSVPREQSVDVWESLKKHDEKINSVQEQLSLLLVGNQHCCHCAPDQKNMVCSESSRTFKDQELVSSQNNCMTISKENVLLKYLLAQSEQIRQLQNQVNLLILKNTDPTLNLPANHPPVTSLSNTATLNLDAGAGSEILQENKSDLKGTSEEGNSTSNIVHHEQTEVTKTSTSTMTSLVFDGNDKVVYHKLLTVVTDVSKEVSHKEISGQHPFAENASPEKERAIKPPLPNSHRSREKCRKSTKNSPVSTESKKYHSPSHSGLDHTDAPVLQNSTERNKCKSTKSEKERKKVQDNANIEKALPNFESVLRNVNELIMENTATERRSPILIKTPDSTPKKKNKHVTKPKLIKSPSSLPDRQLKSKAYSLRASTSTSSDTSLDSVSRSPQHRKMRAPRTDSRSLETYEEPYESSTISRYGLSSPNLSLATKQYLEDYGLVLDKNGESGKTNSSRRARASLSKRYPRLNYD